MLENNLKIKYISIDESGDFGLSKKSSKIFLISCFCFSDPSLSRKIKKLIKNISKNKKINILHAANDSDIFKIKVVKFLQKIEWRGEVFVFKKARKITYLDCLKDVLDKDFIKNSELEKVFVASYDTRKSEVIKIESISKVIKVTTPKNEESLQLADFLSWVVFRKEEFEDDLYFKLLKDNVNISYM